MGEFRRARLHDVVVREGGPGFIAWALARPDGRSAVIEAEGVLVGAAIGVAGAVVAMHVPAPLRELSVVDELVRAVGAGDALPYVTWLVPPPWWARTSALRPVLDPFRLHQAESP
jgi:hypothetical protein